MNKIYTVCLIAIMALSMNAQVTLVKDIRTGTSSSLPAEIFVSDGSIYFKANDGINGTEIWKSDGTELGTALLKDIKPGTSTSSSNPFDFFVFNNELFFTANDGSANPWKTDGTLDGTVKATSGPSIMNPVELGGLIYYKHTDNLADIANDLWQFDGANQSAVADAGMTEENIFDFSGFKNKIFLYMNTVADDATVGNELYEYDPATDLFTLVKDITGDDANSGISNFTVIGDLLYFEALGGLWQTDGTPDGTLAIASASTLTGVASLYAWNGQLFLEGDDLTQGDQLYVYDPGAGTTTNISNIAGTNSNHDPSDYCAYNGYLYYRGEDADDTNGHLFRTDGSTIEQLDNTIIDIDEIVELNGILYFEGDNGTSGNELFMLDPTTISTAISDDLNTADAITIYPNPTSGTIHVNGLEAAEASYELYDLTGRCIARGLIQNNRFDANVDSGVYLLQIIDGQKGMVQKVTVK